MKLSLKSTLSTWLVIALLLTQPFVLATKFSEYETVRLTDAISGKTADYQAVNLTINHGDVISDVPAILYPTIHEGRSVARTLVPLRVISESLGANVSWDGAERRVNIDYGELNIQLVIDDGQALVNGQKATMPDGVPAKLMTYQDITRTLVPVRFVTEMLGQTVEWDGATQTVNIDRGLQTITGIVFDGTSNHQQIRINTSGIVQPATYFLEAIDTHDTSQLVIDVPNARFALTGSDQLDDDGSFFMRVDDEDVASIKGVALRNNTNTIRFIVQLKKPRGYDIQTSQRNVVVELTNNLYHIGVHDTISNSGVDIASSEPPNYKISSWQGSAIIDLFDTKLTYHHMGTNRIDIDQSGIDYVAFSQLDAASVYGEDRQVARVVFHLSEGITVDQLVVEPTDSGLFAYVKDAANDVITYRAIDDSTSQLVIKGDLVSDYQTTYDADKQLVQIVIPGGDVGLKDIDVRPNDALVKQIFVDEQAGNYRVLLLLEDDVEYQQASTSVYTLTISRTASEQSAASQKLIVIDAGHGGKDPGAISPDKSVYEKTIVFDAALQLKEKLESYGFKVLMTRDYDVYVDLYQRSGMANDVGANLFISIHANSVESPSISGIETLYVDDERQSKALATRIQTAMIEQTGARDRGIVERPKLVVIRETKMPAVLVEIGFISNAEELTQLRDRNYVNRVISGIFEGILRYFE